MAFWQFSHTSFLLLLFSLIDSFDRRVFFFLSARVCVCLKFVYLSLRTYSDLLLFFCSKTNYLLMFCYWGLEVFVLKWILRRLEKKKSPPLAGVTRGEENNSTHSFVSLSICLSISLSLSVSLPLSKLGTFHVESEVRPINWITFTRCQPRSLVQLRAERMMIIAGLYWLHTYIHWFSDFTALPCFVNLPLPLSLSLSDLTEWTPSSDFPWSHDGWVPPLSLYLFAFILTTIHWKTNWIK